MCICVCIYVYIIYYIRVYVNKDLLLLRRNTYYVSDLLVETRMKAFGISDSVLIKTALMSVYVTN